MTFPSECVTDANFWIDLHAGGLLDEVFRLPCRWVIPDVVLGELQQPDRRALHSRGLNEVGLSGEQVAEVPELAGRYPRPSRKDLFALVLAKTTGTTLITGDRDLRTAAEQEGMEVHGTLWVLDEMVKGKIIKPQRAAEALERMVRHGRRLPREETEERLQRWRRAAR